ncbi:hypothetical protein GCM10009544_21330 [Streptomyces stramineus]|uniref:Uncharacterized protein n=1 Tax=Streptomyces stramineus TaxID=173861 RepID=A0ABN0ZU71_9ACTN
MFGGTARLGTAARVLLVAGGALAMAAGVVVLVFLHSELADLTGSTWLLSVLGLRLVEIALISGGAWCVARGWWTYDSESAVGTRRGADGV